MHGNKLEIMKYEGDIMILEQILMRWFLRMI